MTNAVQVIDKHSTDILRLNESFSTILNTPIPAEKEDALERLEKMEQLFYGYMQESANLHQRGLAVLVLIVEEGLWKYKLDWQGEPYTQYTDYIQSLYDEVGKYISRRTIHSQITQFRTLSNLDIDAAKRIEVIEKMPYLVQKLLAKVIGKNGEIKELEARSRKKIIDVLGANGLDTTERTDASIVSEFVEKLPELDHKAASGIISVIIAEWKKRFLWFKRDKYLVVRFYQAGRDSKTQKEYTFKLIRGDPDDPIFHEWVETMIQG